MSRDYKNVRAASTAVAARGGTPAWMSILVGVLVGLCIALGVALYINKGSNPFMQRKIAERSAEKAAEPGVKTQKEAASTDKGSDSTVANKHAKTADGKPRFRLLQDPSWNRRSRNRQGIQARFARRAQGKSISCRSQHSRTLPTRTISRPSWRFPESNRRSRPRRCPTGRYGIGFGSVRSRTRMNLRSHVSALKENRLEANLIKVRE